MSDSVQPHRRQPTRHPRPWDSPGKNTGVGCHFLLQCIKVKSESEVAQSCSSLSDPMDCSLLGPSVHGIFQARLLEWGAVQFLNKQSLFFQIKYSKNKSSLKKNSMSSVCFLCLLCNFYFLVIHQFSSVQLLSCVQLFTTPWIAARQASLSITNSWSSLKLMSIELVMPSSHLILCSPLLLLPPIPPSSRLFHNELTVLMRWPKYWSFSFSVSPSNEHPGLISFRMDWLELLVV